MNHYITALKKYADFSGRSSKAEYWYFVLFNIIISIALGITDSMIGIALNMEFGFLSAIYSLAVLVPAVAVGVRRLHDVGKSGWMLLVTLIPIIGIIWLFILMIQDSQPGDNQYGPNPNNKNQNVITPPSPPIGSEITPQNTPNPISSLNTGQNQTTPPQPQV